jgi:hypothetical protein
MACTNKTKPGSLQIPRPEFRNFCRVLTASSPTGGRSPQAPLGGRAAPRIPPAQPPTTSSAKLLPLYTGADTQARETAWPVSGLDVHG